MSKCILYHNSQVAHSEPRQAQQARQLRALTLDCLSASFLQAVRMLHLCIVRFSTFR